MNIQWYPGHMTKTRRAMQESLNMVDVVIELLDARIPQSSQNPDIDQMAQKKARVVVLNKADLADPAVTAAWTAALQKKGYAVVIADSAKGKGVKEAAAAAIGLMHEKIERQKARGLKNVTIRAMVAGIPNVGKSTFINQAAGKATAKTGDKPGVTRGKQWIKVRPGFELMDTPGILWPKFEDQTVGQKLAFCGSVSDVVVDNEALAAKLAARLIALAPGAYAARYGDEVLTEGEDAGIHSLEALARKRGFLKKGGSLDTERAAKILLDEFRGGKLGRISLERPEEALATEASEA